MKPIVQRRIIQAKALAGFPISAAVKINNTLYISGQLGQDPQSGKLVNGVEKQTRVVLDRIGLILNAVGANYSNVVKVTVLLRDIKDFATVNKIYKKYFTKEFPARICYQASALPLPGADIEIECVAYVGTIESLPTHMMSKL